MWVTERKWSAEREQQQLNHGGASSVPALSLQCAGLRPNPVGGGHNVENWAGSLLSHRAKPDFTSSQPTKCSQRISPNWATAGQGGKDLPTSSI
eukprot:scaffold504_cov189-Ochromonas_danica.AAC.4